MRESDRERKREREKGKFSNSTESNAWRRSLFSVFIGNLSQRVPRGALREIFNDYGIVRDVFIKQSKFRGCNYAFVRYKNEWEARRAIGEGSGRLIDGRYILVRSASPVMDRRGVYVRKVRDANQAERLVKSSVRDHRKYSDVLKEMTQETIRIVRQETTRTVRQETTKIVLESSSTNETLKWLHRSVVGRLKTFCHPTVIQENLDKEGVWLQMYMPQTMPRREGLCGQNCWLIWRIGAFPGALEGILT